MCEGAIIVGFCSACRYQTLKIEIMLPGKENSAKFCSIVTDDSMHTTANAGHKGQ